MKTLKENAKGWSRFSSADWRGSCSFLQGA